MKSPASLQDRYWPSTAAYVLAQESLIGHRTSPPEVIERLYGTPLTEPDAYVFLDSPRALRQPFADDGLFGNLEFLSALRVSYFDLFAFTGTPVLLLSGPHIAPTSTISFVANHLHRPSRGPSTP